ncbi:Hypothetical predicted protein [Cloeon dipterum]|nr:Hypothetical predicted protein [Cloeon dipterum]
MAIDPLDMAGQSCLRPPPPPLVNLCGQLQSKKYLHYGSRGPTRDGASMLLCGKRKRSIRERSMSGAEALLPTRRQIEFQKLRISSFTDSSSMDCGPDSSANSFSDHDSSLSSSDSDPSIYANDDGREADDEQSDWVGECSSTETGWWVRDAPGAAGPSSACKPPETVFSEDELSYQRRFRLLRSSMSGREIRAGRRRLEKGRPGFSISSSANERLSRFLQDPRQTQLRLHPIRSGEQEQLTQLARLYSLNVQLTQNGPECSCPVLTKTRHTMRVVPGSSTPQAARGHALSDYKRRRRCPAALGQPKPAEPPEPAVQPSDSEPVIAII